MQEIVRILFVGDVVGEPGREAFARIYPSLKERENINFCIVNAENAAGGSGVDENTVSQLISAGADVLTSGDHIWKNKGVMAIIDRERRLLRPANYPPEAPGRGSGLFPGPGDIEIGVINLLGRVFLQPLDCPFRRLQEERQILTRKTRIIVVDFHAEATSEKVALAHYIDGQVSAVVGTHTHIPTADEAILAGGTAYITDVGMTGGLNSVLGRKAEAVISRFLTGLPAPFPVSRERVCLQGVIIDIDPPSGHARSIRRIKEPLPDMDCY